MKTLLPGRRIYTPIEEKTKRIPPRYKFAFM
jgi:hypothetical protein